VRGRGGTLALGHHVEPRARGKRVTGREALEERRLIGREPLAPAATRALGFYGAASCLHSVCACVGERERERKRVCLHLSCVSMCRHTDLHNPEPKP